MLPPFATPPATSPSPDEILVVDDDPEVRDAMCDVLTDEGYRVGKASHGADAVEWLKSRPAPRLIVLDLTMPVMDGHEFLDYRAAHPELARIPVVVVSASFDSQLVHTGIEVLRKPLDIDNLLAVIRQTLQPPP